jgi:hypothetical protein
MTAMWPRPRGCGAALTDRNRAQPSYELERRTAAMGPLADRLQLRHVRPQLDQLINEVIALCAAIHEPT